jgi:hypothetical protein
VIGTLSLLLAAFAAPLATVPLATVPGAAEDSIASLSSIQLEPGGRVREALSWDVDQDGTDDLVLVESRADSSTRRLAIHLRHASGPAFTSVPDASLALTADVVAFAVIDAHQDPGREIVLFNATGAFLWRPRGSAEVKVEKLFACEFLWQIADKDDAFAWQKGVADLDADGLEDLVLPGPAGYLVALQRREGASTRFVTSELALPAGAARDPSDHRRLAGDEGPRRVEVRGDGVTPRTSVRISVGKPKTEQRVERPPLVEVSEAVPGFALLDWDADGDLDLLALSARTLHVFRQEPRGQFPAAARLDLESPVAVDLQRTLDVSWAARALDLDRDGRADMLFFAGDKRSKEARTQALVFLQSSVPKEPRAGEPPPTPLFGTGAPSQLLVIGGFARPLRPFDVDGDGLVDLVVGAFQPDLIDELRAVSSERIDASLYVYRNLKKGFSKRPDLVHGLSVSARSRVFAADFVGDVDGNGTSELLLREEDARLRMFATRRTKEGLAVVPEPIWELAVDPESRLVLPERIGPGRRDLWVVEKEQVLCASFR